MNNTELKERAWKRLWTDKWFGRLFGGMFLLGLAGYAVQIVLNGILGRLGVQNWLGYLESVAQNRQTLTTPVPNLTPEFIFQATSSTVLTLFFSYIMAGISAYGCAVVLRRCLANNEEGWLGDAFSGFRDPFGMLWLMLRTLFIYFLWSLLLVVPVIIPLYRYRFVWLVKAEHPDWSAGRCLAECRKLMKGNMMKSFWLDWSYWKPITLMLLPILSATMGVAMIAFAGKDHVPVLVVAGLVIFLSFVVYIPVAIIVTQYLRVGQGFLYEELKHRTTEVFSGDL